MRSFFGVLLRNKPNSVRFICTFISSRGTMPALKIVIPDRRTASKISVYGKWTANAGGLCRCPSEALLRRRVGRPLRRRHAGRRYHRPERPERFSLIDDGKTRVQRAPMEEQPCAENNSNYLHESVRPILQAD